MTISYNWLKTFLPVQIQPEELSVILTSIGLEVEHMETLGGFPHLPETLVCGHVLSCEQHPDADKLKVTTVDIGLEEKLQIVCGAPNVATGQKVIVATIGTTLQPSNGEPFKIKKSKIRGMESFGMLCAGDEIGVNQDHDGLMLLPNDAPVGVPVKNILGQDSMDVIFEIGITPNRADAMSHYGVARDVAAYLSHHQKNNVPLQWQVNEINANGQAPITVKIDAEKDCLRYSGIYIQNIEVKESPEWLQQRLKAIGVNCINNVVDISNYVLHATGQPLHIFDADKIEGNTIIVKKATQDYPFITLDGNEIKLSSNDLMISDAQKPMCIAGVYGGKNSGVTNETKNIFIESACFHPETIRITSTSHQLRTDAAARFEKGTDVSITPKVLLYATQLLLEVAGGTTVGEVIDVVTTSLEKRTIQLDKKYLHVLSGKQYAEEEVLNILQNLGYECKENTDEYWLMSVPFHKTMVHHAADLVQEVMRMDGLDHIPIPPQITMHPSTDENIWKQQLKEKACQVLVGAGFREIFTNSIVNSAWYAEPNAPEYVRLLNSLSAELDVLRPDMLQSGLQVIAYNLNRKNHNLRLFEIGKIYHRYNEKYTEEPILAIYLTGHAPADWQHPAKPYHFFSLKGEIQKLLHSFGWDAQFKTLLNDAYLVANEIMIGKKQVGVLAEVHPKELKKAGIKVPVFYAYLHWDTILSLYQRSITYKEISKFPTAERDLSIVVDLSVTYSDILQATRKAQIAKLQNMELFDVFQSDKLGSNKKSMAMKYHFSDDQKTLTDQEIDGMMQKLTNTYSQLLNAEIRK